MSRTPEYDEASRRMPGQARAVSEGRSRSLSRSAGPRPTRPSLQWRDAFFAAGLAGALLLLADFSPGTSSVPTPPPPETKRVEVADNYFGVTVVDPYRWLEDRSEPAVESWLEAQNTYARSILDRAPGREKLRQAVAALVSVDSIELPIEHQGRYFFRKRGKNQQQYVICIRRASETQDQVLIDPLSFSPDGLTSVHIRAVSEDGTLMAYGVQQGGEDTTAIRFFDVGRRKDLPEVLPKDYYSGGIAIRPDNRGFFYARYGTEGPRVFYREFGTNSGRDEIIFGEGVSPKSTIGIALSDDGHSLVMDVAHGWAKNDVYIFPLDRPHDVTSIVEGIDAHFSVRVFGDRFFAHTDWQAPKGRILAGNLQTPAPSSWEEIIPESRNVITGFTLAGGKLIARYLENAVPLLKVFAADGKPTGEVWFPVIGSVGDPEGRWPSNEAFFTFESFHIPPTIYRYDVPTQKQEIWWGSQVPFSTENYVVKQAWYRSKDGTRAPLFLAHAKGAKFDGSNPTILHGYGGFNVSMTPTYSPRTALWLQKGGVFALAILRGGGEFGEEWHRAGMLANKQNVFDDFIAAAEWLVQERYTSFRYLVINGVSNGGLLVGAAMTQRPESFRIVICRKPDLDMLRRHVHAHNVYATQEYGSADNPDHFRFLYAYSPYRRVKKGTKYPAVYLTSGDADQRVDPFQARKMTAALQWATASGYPVVLSYGKHVGHSGGSTLEEEIAELTDEFSFIFSQLGLTP